MEEARGLYKKYEVTKLEGVTEEIADYFVLRLDKDQHARNAAFTYAISVTLDNPELSLELMKRVESYEEENV